MTNNLAKWSPEEDQLLREGVRLYGIKWESVKKYMKDVRSINSLIKRWHGKIKYEPDMQPIRQSTGRYFKVAPTPPPQPKKIPNQSAQHNSDTPGSIWKKQWSERDDKKMKLLVVETAMMDWNSLAEAMQTEVDQVKIRWRKVIYPQMIRQSPKGSTAMKWSSLEDKILNAGYKQNVDWEDEGRCFLPQRSLGSIEARWRRVAKSFEVKETSFNKYLAIKDCLKRIARLRREQQKKVSSPEQIEPQAQIAE